MCPSGGCFFRRTFAMEVKKPCSFEDQLQKLINRNCLVEDKEKALSVLQNINYYRLTAYFLPFKSTDKKYKDGTTFESVYRIYEFDRKLSNFIFAYIEEIELMLRIQLSNYHSLKYGALGYTDPNNFNKKHNKSLFDENIQTAIANNKKQFFVKHHIQKYDSQFPLWVIIELFSTGELSFFFADMLRCDKKYLAKNLFNTTDNIASNWLLCFTHLRNYCAHYSRLYYNKFSTIPATPKNYCYTLKDRVFDYLLVLKFLYPEANKWNTNFMIGLENLINEYSDVISLYHLGFPSNWKELLQKHHKNSDI